MDALLAFALTTTTFAGAALGHAIAGLLRAVPAEDRPFRRPPPAFARVVWPAARVAAYYLRWLVPRRALERVRSSLKRAELQGRVEPEEWLGVVAAYALLGGLAGAGFAVGFDLDLVVAGPPGAVLAALLLHAKLRSAANCRPTWTC